MNRMPSQFINYIKFTYNVIYHFSQFYIHGWEWTESFCVIPVEKYQSFRPPSLTRETTALDAFIALNERFLFFSRTLTIFIFVGIIGLKLVSGKVSIELILFISQWVISGVSIFCHRLLLYLVCSKVWTINVVRINSNILPQKCLSLSRKAVCSSSISKNYVIFHVSHYSTHSIHNDSATITICFNSVYMANIQLYNAFFISFTNKTLIRISFNYSCKVRCKQSRRSLLLQSS